MPTRVDIQFTGGTIIKYSYSGDLSEKKISDQDNVDRIQIERFFSTAKRKNGMGLIDRKREDSSLMTIAFSVLVTNIFGTFKLAVEEGESIKSKEKNQR